MVSHNINIDSMLGAILCVKINTSAYVKLDCGSDCKAGQWSLIIT